MVNSPKIKISEKLDELVDETDLTNIEIADEIGISPTSMTHYRQGEANPRLTTVVDLATILDVSLEYLILGRSDDAEEVDTDPVLQYLDKSIEDAQAQAAQHTSLVSRVGQRLAEQVDEEVEKHLSEDPSHQLFPGMVTHKELLTIEEHSQATKLLIRSLQYNILEATSETSGTFITTTANNLSQGRKYQYLFPDVIGTDWHSVVNDLRQVLIEQTGSEQIVRDNCRFRITPHPVSVGYGLYQLDEEGLELDNSILYDFLNEHDYIDNGGFGYIISPSSDIHGDVVMNETHLSGAKTSFEKLWKDAEPI